MTGILRFALALALLAMPASAADWNFPEDAIVESMGLPTRTEGELEVRVWLGGGVAHPFFLYRIVQNGSDVTGAMIAWDVIEEWHEDSTPRDLRKAHRWAKKAVRLYCGRKWIRSGDVLSCEVDLESEPDWAKMLRSIDPDRLRQLAPRDSLGSADCIVEDGTIVSVEIVEGEQYSRRTYANPQACCPWPECRVMENVMDTVNQIR